VNKTVLVHTPELLIIGLDFRQRFFRLGLGITLSLLSVAGIFQLLGYRGLLGTAIVLPLLLGLALTGLVAIYDSLLANNDVYQKSTGAFFRYSGNLLTGKRVQDRRVLAACAPSNNLMTAHRV